MTGTTARAHTHVGDDERRRSKPARSTPRNTESPGSRVEGSIRGFGRTSDSYPESFIPYCPVFAGFSALSGSEGVASGFCPPDLPSRGI